MRFFLHVAKKMYHLPRCIIAGLSGGSGKTLVSLGLARALSSIYHLKTFKKGPDYIDAAWLSIASGSPSGNLDPFFSSPETLRRLLYHETISYNFCLIEGNRGLFDGLDTQGSCSTAQLARTLNTPIILVVDCTKMTRTVAALVAGCANFEPNTPLAGIILNKTASSRQRNLIKQCIEESCSLPVLGVLPRIDKSFLKENRSGLMRPTDQPETDTYLDSLADFIREHIDIGAIEAIARNASPLQLPKNLNSQHTNNTSSNLNSENPPRTEKAAPPAATNFLTRFPVKSPKTLQPVIGIVRDAAFWFYYQENIDALATAGAQLCEISILDSAPWPALDGLYIGGGPPDIDWKRLSANSTKLQILRQMHATGRPIFTEGTGLLCLLEEMKAENTSYSMAGILPASATILPSPSAIGYTECNITTSRKICTSQTTFRGHQFQYFQCHWLTPLAPKNFLFQLTRGKGIAELNSQFYDGILEKQTVGCGMHIYAPAFPVWARWLVHQAQLHKQG